jgi:tetratricopeptide (TPR) repeat protein
MTLLGGCQAASAISDGAKRFFGFGAGGQSQALFAAQPQSAAATPRQQVRFRREHCYLAPYPAQRGAPDFDWADDAELEAIIGYCLQPPSRRDARFTEYLANSYFHAGKARRMLGQSRGRPELLTEAADNLEIVVNLLGQRSTSPTRDDALLELSRTYRLLRQPGGRRYAEELSSDSPEVRFERAMWILDALEQTRPPQTAEQETAQRSQRVIALDYLRIFRAPQPDVDRFVGTQGPAKLAELANTLGEESLEAVITEDSSHVARDRFEDATRAIEQLHGGDWDRLAVHTNVNLGRAYLRLAGLQRAPEDGDYECGLGGGGDRLSQEPLRAAAASFERARARNADAPEPYWGIGCVRMALGDAAGAAQEFQRAVSLPQYSGALDPWDYQIALGRAWDQLGQPDRAIGSYYAALRGQPGPDAVAQRRIHMAMAQLYFARPDEGNALRSIALAVGAPEGDLDPARDTAPNARAYLLRAKILRNQSEFRWARTNLERAAAMGGDHRAEAFMELSQLELSRNDIYAAVRAIDDAVVANRTDERYRRTACETRIQHWDALRRDPALREQGALHCVAYSTQDSTADAEQNI